MLTITTLTINSLTYYFVVVNNNNKNGGENMKNLDLRKEIETNNLKYWEVANKLKITDGNFSRLLRLELDDIQKQTIMKAINELKEEKEKWNQNK